MWEILQNGPLFTAHIRIYCDQLEQRRCASSLRKALAMWHQEAHGHITCHMREKRGIQRERESLLREGGVKRRTCIDEFVHCREMFVCFKVILEWSQGVEREKQPQESCHIERERETSRASSTGTKLQNEKGGSKCWGAGGSGGGVGGGVGAREMRERVLEVIRVRATEVAASAETVESRQQGDEEGGAAAGRWISKSAGNERLRAASLSPMSKGKMVLHIERESEFEREREKLRAASLSPSCKAKLVETVRARASEQESDEESAGGGGGGGEREGEGSSTPSTPAKRVKWNQVTSHSSWAGAEARLRRSPSPSSSRTGETALDVSAREFCFADRFVALTTLSVCLSIRRAS
jgi:hypothetical protein